MKKNTRLWLPLLAVVASLLLFASSAAKAAEHEHALKVGKNAEITFRTEMKVGDVTLKPGRYQLQHRVDGGDHFVHFTELTKGIRPTDTGVPKAHPGEAKCRLESLSKKVARTTIYATADRVTKVEVAGENVAHLF